MFYVQPAAVLQIFILLSIKCNLLEHEMRSVKLWANEWENDELLQSNTISAKMSFYRSFTYALEVKRHFTAIQCDSECGHMLSSNYILRRFYYFAVICHCLTVVQSFENRICIGVCNH